MEAFEQSGPPIPRLPARDRAGHKGTFGTVGIIGGCCAGDSRMIGAPALAALAALRSGCGLARLAMPGPIIAAGIALCPSATGIALPVDEDGALSAHEAAPPIDALTAQCESLVIGPGLGRGDGPRAVSLRCVLQQDVPVVVDADAINALSEVPELTRDFRAHAVLTPHPGEYSRLARSLRIGHNPVDPASRPDAAAELARRLGCIVVLKGPGTVVSDGQRTRICERGHPCLATAGTGDVLSGLIAGLIAQFSRPAHPGARNTGAAMSLFDAASAAVQAHAIAGERWAEHHGAEAGLLAVELAEGLPAVIDAMRERA
jgi:NAD(P)H-hydrate epimerase